MKEHRFLWKAFLSKEKLFLVIVVFMLMVISMIYSFQQSIFSQAGYQQAYPNAGLEFYYSLFRIGTNPFLFILMMLMLPNIMSYDLLNMHQNHAAYPIETRLSRKCYYQETYLKNTIFTFCIVMIIQLGLLLISHLTLAPIHFQSMTYPDGYYITTQLLCTNECMNLILFLIMTALGYALISGLIFSLQSFITNKYVYRCCGVIIGILLVLFPALIQGYLPYPESAFLIQINNLVALGLEHVRENPYGLSHWSMYLICFIIYAGICYGCFQVLLIRRESND